MKDPAVLVARERTNQELIRALAHPACLFVGGLMLINWYADRPGGPGRIEGAAMWAALGGVCAAGALAPTLPTLVQAEGEMVKSLAPLLAPLAMGIK